LHRFEPTVQLYTQLGMCKLAMSQQAPLQRDCHALSADAAAAFTAARKLGDTEPSWLFLHQALAGACQFDAALTGFDAPLANRKYADKMGRGQHGVRGMYLLMGDHPVEAVAELTSAAAAKEKPDRADALMLARALSLCGRHEDAVAKARAAWADQPT